jgi:MFS family permease
VIDTPYALNPFGDFFWSAIGTLTAALISGTLCALIVVLIPRRIRLARDIISIVPANAIMVGCLSVFSIGAISIVYCISLVFILPLLLLPVAVVIWLGTVVLLIGGWVVIAEPFGQWLLRRRGVYAAPMAAAAVGGFVLTLMTLVVSRLPIFGWISILLGLIIAATGMGGLILTRLGTRAYPETVVTGDFSSARLV